LLSGERWCPQEHPSILSSAFYFYANALIKLGSRKHLEQEDLWDVSSQHQAERLFEQYAAVMEKTSKPERFPHVRIALLSNEFRGFSLVADVIYTVSLLNC
jgi:DNA-binding transcriptional regulator PaaX